MTNDYLSEPLSERAQHLLKVLIESYIDDGHPVGSRTLSRKTELQVSPATIRNVMSDLERLGLVSSPHTSAGRVPTVKGYRCFVDTLVTVKPLKNREVATLARSLAVDPEASHKEIVTAASSVLSAITRMAGIVTVPRREHAALRQIEFLPLGGNRVLVILVVNEQEVQNRVVQLDREFSASQLVQAANYLNERFAGRDLTDVRSGLVKTLKDTRAHLNRMMLNAVEMAQCVLEPDETGGEFVVAGRTNLMDFEELSDVEKLRRLFEAFNEQRDILHLLDRSLGGEGVQIFIGEESGHQLLDSVSVVTAPYAVDDEMVGVLAVIGPTRMAYERVIPIVEATAKLLGSALKSQS